MVIIIPLLSCPVHCEIQDLVSAVRARRLIIPHPCARRLFLTHVQNQPIAPGGLLLDDDAIRSMLRTAGRPARLSFSDTPPAQQDDEAAGEENPLIS